MLGYLVVMDLCSGQIREKANRILLERNHNISHRSVLINLCNKPRDLDPKRETVNPTSPLRLSALHLPFHPTRQSPEMD